MIKRKKSNSNSIKQWESKTLEELKKQKIWRRDYLHFIVYVLMMPDWPKFFKS